MDFSTLNYKLRCNITDLHNRFSGWDGGNLRLNSADFSTSISGSTLTVQVRADISYSDSGFSPAPTPTPTLRRPVRNTCRIFWTILMMTITAT